MGKKAALAHRIRSSSCSRRSLHPHCQHGGVGRNSGSGWRGGGNIRGSFCPGDRRSHARLWPLQPHSRSHRHGCWHRCFTESDHRRGHRPPFWIQRRILVSGDHCRRGLRNTGRLYAGDTRSTVSQ
jgi:hypothetical protein